MSNILSYLAAGNNGQIKVNYINHGTGDDLKNSVVTIVNAVVGALAIVAVIVIIIGGVNYMTSAGDAGKVKKAKDTILYGVIGLVVCVLAFAIVNFVVMNILG